MCFFDNFFPLTKRKKKNYNHSMNELVYRMVFFFFIHEKHFFSRSLYKTLSFSVFFLYNGKHSPLSISEKKNENR